MAVSLSGMLARSIQVSKIEVKLFIDCINVIITTAFDHLFYKWHTSQYNHFYPSTKFLLFTYEFVN